MYVIVARLFLVTRAFSSHAMRSRPVKPQGVGAQRKDQLRIHGIGAVA